MATPEQAMDAFNDVVDSYHELLQMAHDALAAGVTQQERNSVRQTIAGVIADSKERRAPVSDNNAE
jgi:hypothetical protein